MALSDEDYWELESGDLILVETEEGLTIVEFAEHLFDGGFFYKPCDGALWQTAAREDLRVLIQYR